MVQKLAPNLTQRAKAARWPWYIAVDYLKDKPYYILAYCSNACYTLLVDNPEVLLLQKSEIHWIKYWVNRVDPACMIQWLIQDLHWTKYCTMLMRMTEEQTVDAA